MVAWNRKQKPFPITVNFEDLSLLDKRPEVDKIEVVDGVFVVSQSKLLQFQLKVLKIGKHRYCP